jgi:hypothetical protein
VLRRASVSSLDKALAALYVESPPIFGYDQEANLPFTFQSLMDIAIPYLAGPGALLTSVPSGLKEYLTSTVSALLPAPATSVLQAVLAFPVHMIQQFSSATM